MSLCCAVLPLVRERAFLEVRAWLAGVVPCFGLELSLVNTTNQLCHKRFHASISVITIGRNKPAF
jgi:hypothetical protein